MQKVSYKLIRDVDVQISKHHVEAYLLTKRNPAEILRGILRSTTIMDFAARISSPLFDWGTHHNGHSLPDIEELTKLPSRFRKTGKGRTVHWLLIYCTYDVDCQGACIMPGPRPDFVAPKICSSLHHNIQTSGVNEKFTCDM